MINKLLLLTMLLPINMISQPAIVNTFNSTSENIKSPQVHLLKQFADHPVDLSRGLVDVSVPVYDIKFADKIIPIKLLFHSSGLKANIAENGILGLKWALNVGGFISREVRGYPDDLVGHKQGIDGFYGANWMTLYGATSRGRLSESNPVYGYLGFGGYLGPGFEGIEGKYEDTEYDIFTFSLPTGESGKFILKDINGNKSASFMPHKPFKLNNPTIDSYHSDLYGFVDTFSKFQLVDDQGYIYQFGKNDSGTSYHEQSIDRNYVNNWLLTSIISPNKRDTLKFEYNYRQVYTNSPKTPLIINDYLDDYLFYYPSNFCQEGIFGYSSLFNALEPILDDPGGYFQQKYNEPPYLSQESFIISKITYNDISVNFTYKEVIDDINDLLLDKIEILKANATIKKVVFDVVSPSGASPFTYEKPSYLNSINVLGSTNSIVEKYNFEYYNLDQLPDVDKLAHSADYWGYYNSEVANVILHDTIDIYYMPPHCTSGFQQVLKKEIGSGNDRYSNSNDMKIGMLKSIIYPTGGKTTFDYEANKYYDVYKQIFRDCGGLRIKSIISEDVNNKDILKKREFTYGKNEDGIGKIPEYIMPSYYPFRNFFEDIRTSYYIDDDVSIESIPGIGSYWTRYMTGFFPSNYYTFLNNLVYYEKVTEYIGDNNKNIGKIENFYSINIPLRRFYEFDSRYTRYMKSKYSIDPSNFWQGNHLSKKIEYKRANSFYSKVKQTDYLYSSYIVDEIYDLSIFKHKMFVGYGISNGQYNVKTATIELERIKDNPSEYFGYKTQKYTIGVENLTGIKEKIYFDNDSIVKTTTNIYDVNRPTFLKERRTVNSKGKNISEKYLYPFDINTGVYNDMTIANVISPVVEKVSLNDTNVTGSTLLTYKKSDTNFVPDQNFISELLNPIPYSGFSAFNGTTKDSHYSSYPEITYDSFDVDGNPTQVTSKGDIKICFIWGYDKKYLVAKIENMIYTNIPPSLITAIETASLPTGSESNLLTALQNLRNHNNLSGAIVTTYTYKPLIGMTSMTDSKGDVTYYQYDSYGRLEQIKDKENNILSKNEYHYKNQ